MKNHKGFSALEALISAGIVLFVLFSVFYAVDSVITSSALINKQTELLAILDDKVNDYLLTGDFDDTSSGSMTFSDDVIADGNIRRFVASDSDFDVSVRKNIYQFNRVQEAMNLELGPYMQRVDEIYRDSGATTIDELNVLQGVEVARQTYLSSSTEKWSSNTGTLLNLSDSNINATIPISNPPYQGVTPSPYVTVAPHTNADVASGIEWRCTAFGFDSKLLPQWCAL